MGNVLPVNACRLSLTTLQMIALVAQNVPNVALRMLLLSNRMKSMLLIWKSALNAISADKFVRWMR
jgi:hypothetical protein